MDAHLSGAPCQSGCQGFVGQGLSPGSVQLETCLSHQFLLGKCLPELAWGPSWLHPPAPALSGRLQCGRCLFLCVFQDCYFRGNTFIVNLRLYS